MKRTITIVLIIFSCLIIGILVMLISSGMGANGANAMKKENPVIDEYADSVSYSPNASIITNIKNSKKYLRVKITMEITDEKSSEYFIKNEYKIKDTIISVVRNSSEDELIAPGSQELLKNRIREALGYKIDTKNLIDIYIYEYVIQ